MNTLADSQALLQSMVTGARSQGPDLRGVLPGNLIRETRRFDADSRVGVYRASFQRRLAECVREFFPCLKFVLGDEVFDSLAGEFLRSHPPSHPNLSRLVDEFPSFLSAATASCEDGDDPLWADFLRELAELELAIHHVYNGVGPELSPSFSLSAAADGPDAVPADLQVAASPCLRMVSMTYPAAEFFTDFRTGKTPEFPTPRPTYAALSRRAFRVEVTHLNREQHELLTRLADGTPIRECLFAATADGPEANRELVFSRWEWIQCWIDWRLLMGQGVGSAS